MLEAALKTVFDRVDVEPEVRRWEFQKRWRMSFASGVEAWSGPLRDCSWHAFARGLAPCEEGAAAIAGLEGAVGELLVTEEPSLAPMFRVRLSSYAGAYSRLVSAWKSDIYVIHESWTWTFVATHEAGIGPFFTAAD